MCWVMFWFRSLGLKADTTILMSFFPCLYLIWMYISLFLSCPSLPLSLSLYQCLSLCVCLFMCFFPSLLFFFCRSFRPCHWLSLSQPSVKTPQELHSVKFFSVLLFALRYRVKLASHSFFLGIIVHAHSHPQTSRSSLSTSWCSFWMIPFPKLANRSDCFRESGLSLADIKKSAA